MRVNYVWWFVQKEKARFLTIGAATNTGANVA